MGKLDARVLIIEKAKGVFLVYGEWEAEGDKCRGLLCKVRQIDKVFIRCEPLSGTPLSVHASLEEAAWHGISEGARNMHP